MMMNEDGLPREAIKMFSTWILTEYGNHKSWKNISTQELDASQILGSTNKGDLMLESRVGEIHRYNPTTTMHDLVEAMENVVFFGYYEECLYLLEKKKDFKSY